METTTTRSGQTVLAKVYKGVLYPKTYANKTQAEKAAKASGGYVRAGWPFLVVIPDEATIVR